MNTVKLRKIMKHPYPVDQKKNLEHRCDACMSASWSLLDFTESDYLLIAKKYFTPKETSATLMEPPTGCAKPPESGDTLEPILTVIEDVAALITRLLNLKAIWIALANESQVTFDL